MFNRKLKAKIFEHFDSQIDFAQVLDVGEVYVSRVVRGRQKLSDTEKSRWAKKLECDVNDIFPKTPNEGSFTL